MTRYTGDRTRLIQFPLGGIGGRTELLGGWGQLIGRPRTFFVLAMYEGRWLLQGPPALSDWAGDGSGEDLLEQGIGQGRSFASSTFENRFPVARIELVDPTCPTDVTLDVWSPFVPGGGEASALPAMVLDVTLTEPVDALLYAFVEDDRELRLEGAAPPQEPWPPDRPLFSDRQAVWDALRSRGHVPGAWRVPLNRQGPTSVVLAWGPGDPLPHRAATFALADRLAAAPEPFGEAVRATLPVLRSQTVTNADPFDAFEGWLPSGGSCEGTCLHVWSAAAPALGDLFPTLERSCIDQALDRMQADGAIAFRSTGTAPAADGQMALVARAHRHWRTTGDDAWLRDRWPRIERALAYAWTGWDADRDGVMEGAQHVTYDVDLYGPNPLTAGWYLTALRAAAVMARALGVEADYDTLAHAGAAWVDAHLWNGAYYAQQIRPLDSPPPSPALQFPVGGGGQPWWQLGNGCLSGQLAGSWFGKLSGLGDVLDPEHTRTALASIVRYNWRDRLDHPHLQRVFAVRGEAGLLNATFPDEHQLPARGRPRVPSRSPTRSGPASSTWSRRTC